MFSFVTETETSAIFLDDLFEVPENIKQSLKTFDDDISREKGIVIDANSNEKRLKEEKNELIEIDSKYYQTEKASSEDLDYAKNNLKLEIDKVKELINQKKIMKQ